MSHKYHAAVFEIDPLPDKQYSGYTMGDTWNGWDCPVFTYDVAVQILNDSARNGYVWRYDTSDDTFVVWGEDFYSEEFTADLIEIDGKIEIVYPIGAYCWIWEKAE